MILLYPLRLHVDAAGGTVNRKPKRSEKVILQKEIWKIEKYELAEFLEHRNKCLAFRVQVGGLRPDVLKELGDLGLLDGVCPASWISGCPGLGDLAGSGNFILVGSGNGSRIQRETA